MCGRLSRCLRAVSRTLPPDVNACFPEPPDRSCRDAGSGGPGRDPSGRPRTAAAAEGVGSIASAGSNGGLSLTAPVWFTGSCCEDESCIDQITSPDDDPVDGDVTDEDGMKVVKLPQDRFRGKGGRPPRGECAQ